VLVSYQYTNKIYLMLIEST